MNLVLEKTSQVAWFTDVRAMLQALGLSASEFSWHVSDVETNRHPNNEPEGWWTGAALERLLSQDGLQFIWGVFSAFPLGTRFDVTEPPFADGNQRLWTGSAALKPQLDGALFEIVCWDSSATLLIGISAEQAARFGQTYPDAKLLVSGS
ncbi:hypothetical protein [Roseateles sp. LYH14W]|uniref:Uncharacterized protein n=1 Tax=Pelomonas parva TaxID=3299032 RepID=A0ABW7F1C7_9BURK